jgi:hypothetical protein
MGNVFTRFRKKKEVTRDKIVIPNIDKTELIKYYNKWNRNIENLIKSHGEWCISWESLHNQAFNYYGDMAFAFTLSTTLLQGFIGILSLGSLSLNTKFLFWSMVSVFIISVINAFISTLAGVTGASDNATKHNNAANDYAKLYTKIVKELSIDSSVRKDAIEFLIQITEQYNGLKQLGPDIPDKIKKKYKKKYDEINKNDTKYTTGIPEILDDTHIITVYSDEDSKMRKFVNNDVSTVNNDDSAIVTNTRNKNKRHSMPDSYNHNNTISSVDRINRDKSPYNDRDKSPDMSSSSSDSPQISPISRRTYLSKSMDTGTDSIENTPVMDSGLRIHKSPEDIQLNYELERARS